MALKVIYALKKNQRLLYTSKKGGSEMIVLERYDNGSVLGIWIEDLKNNKHPSIHCKDYEFNEIFRKTRKRI